MIRSCAARRSMSKFTHACHLPVTGAQAFDQTNDPNHPLPGSLFLVTFTVLASPLYVFLRLRSGSILTAAICHGSFGASMLLTFAPIAGGNELTAGLLALPGILVMAVVNIALYFAMQRGNRHGG